MRAEGSSFRVRKGTLRDARSQRRCPEISTQVHGNMLSQVDFRRLASTGLQFRRLRHQREGVVRTVHRVEFADKLQAAAIRRKSSTYRVRRLRPTGVRLANAPRGCGRSRRRGDSHLGTDVISRVAEVTWRREVAESSSLNGAQAQCGVGARTFDRCAACSGTVTAGRGGTRQRDTSRLRPCGVSPCSGTATGRDAPRVAGRRHGRPLVFGRGDSGAAMGFAEIFSFPH